MAQARACLESNFDGCRMLLKSMGEPSWLLMAENDLEAQVVIEDEIFQNDLAVLESSGRPIWDGEAEINIREADEVEKGKFESSRAKAVLEGEVGERESWMVYLVPVSDPTDDKRIET